MSGSSLPPTLLDELPAVLRGRLDERELAAPAPWLHELLRELGSTLRAHVVAYRAERRPAGTAPQLCSLLVSAQLDDEQLARLRAAETGLPQPLVLVAYARPARLRAR